MLADGRCSCPAVGLCRHLVRTVLAYQRQAGATGTWGTVTGAAALPAGTTGFTDPSVVQGVAYGYRIQAFTREAGFPPITGFLFHNASLTVRPKPSRMDF